MRNLVSLLLLCLVAAGCDALGVGTATVDGKWILTARNLSDGSSTCSIQSMSLDLIQTRDRFSGVASASTISCIMADGTSRSLTLSAQPVIDGTVNDDRITFYVGAVDWRHEARVTSSSSMSGTVQVKFGPPIGTMTFAGSFGAARTDSVALRPLVQPSR